MSFATAEIAQETGSALGRWVNEVDESEKIKGNWTSVNKIFRDSIFLPGFGHHNCNQEVSRDPRGKKKLQ